VSHLLELVEEACWTQDGKIDFDEWEIMGKSTSTKPTEYTEYSPRVTSQADQEKNSHGISSPR
jgi:hypothetical protein